MIENCRENLIQISNLLDNIHQDSYTHPCAWLSGATIGQHVRHILEFYECVIRSKESGIINYDLRARKAKIEADLETAKSLCTKIASQLEQTYWGGSLVLEGNFSTNQESPAERIITTYHRELAYCLEHSIHHQALIKVALIETNEKHLIDEYFGVAPATIRSKTT